jgi:CheY-like chemotaxis protein/two-component sensor histidine kinase
MKNVSILVIDDEPDNFDVIQAFLSKNNYVLHYAANGEGGLAALDNLTPDLILLDVMMPGIDGIEVCRRIRERAQWQAVPIIMVTALTAKEDLAQCLAMGADDFISKPVNSYELKARVQSMLRIKAQYDRLEEFAKFQRNTINVLGKNLQELTGNLARSFPHELNTPLNGIIGVLQLLKDDWDDLEKEEIYELLDMAQQSADRLERLTKRFMAYLELEILQSQGKSLTPSKSATFSPVVQKALQQLSSYRNRQEDVQFIFTVPEVPLVDRYWILILVELVDNALKFSAPQTPVVVKADLDEGLFQFTIEDHGYGMTPQQVSNVGTFVKYKHSNYTQEGIGLGLKLVQKVMELARGDFQIDSQEDQGTIVQVKLPLSA